MSLQFIIGSSGCGKSFCAYERIIEQAGMNPQKTYYVIVPEQFTMQTQKTLVEMSPGQGILNIDILSFDRLAYRVFEEVGGDNRKLLEDTGKSMVLQKMVQLHQKELPYLGSQMKKPGYLDEVKSLLSEFMQYDITAEELKKMEEMSKDRALLRMKLHDVGVLYRAFCGYLRDHYMTGEEVMDVLMKVLPFSKKVAGSTILLDGFTGFTPVQNKVIRELLILCDQVWVTVTMDIKAAAGKGGSHQLFYMSKKMMHSLSGLTKEIIPPIMLKSGNKSRFAQSPALDFLEKNLFRYKREVYEKEQEEIQIFAAGNPLKEMEEAARRMAYLVRVKGLHYGEMAVITGNLEEYKSLAAQVFEEAGIPFFIDEKHSVLMNPFVEFLRAAMEMVVKGFSYKSVFRYLRCQMSDVTREEADRLENYVIALGIRGFSHWEEKWVRIYRGMAPEELLLLNELRGKFVSEVRFLAEGFSGEKKTVEQFCRIFYQFIVQCGIQQKLKEKEEAFSRMGNKAMEKEYGQVYGIVMNLLDKMVEILGEEEVNRQEFRQLLETGLSKAEVALIPPGMDQVLVGDMERTRLKDVKALFFVGVNEGNIPKNTDAGGFLTELDREFFESAGVELAPGPKEQMNMQRFYLYLNLTKPSCYLTLSYSLSNNKGEAITPAYLIRNIKTLFPNLSEEMAAEWKDTVEKLELPGTGIEYFLNGLSEAAFEKEDPVFAELYSWYLRSPVYRPVVRALVKAAYTRKPKDVISKSVAKILYGELSPESATRLEQYCACAFAHFLRYGVRLTERAEYEFRSADMGNVMHLALERFAIEVRKRGLTWAELTEKLRNEMIDQCLDEIAADYGNTILKSSARNSYMIERTRKILHRTVWALQEQLKNGCFQPEGFEVTFGGGRIDRVDVMEEETRVYVRVIDYKTGNTAFDFVSLYHGLQLQLMVYLNGAIEVEKRKYPGKEILPAGVFYYNIKDPMIQEKMNADMGEIGEKILKELKMNGLSSDDPQLVRKMDATAKSLPVSFNKDGSFRKGSSVATREQFELLNHFVKEKIKKIQESILEGDASLSPYQRGNKNACTYCPYQTVCGFDHRLPGYDFRRLKEYSQKEIWKLFEEEVQ